MGNSLIVAIDGPAGAGKSTVAKAAAARLGLTYLDTGAMYRCVGLAHLRNPATDPAELARSTEIQLGERVLLDGEDVSEQIRAPQVSEAASRVSADPRVREVLVARQKAMLAEGGYVAEGRDIGTNVAPHAPVKVFLTASEQERARRRATQVGLGVEEVLAQQRVRDRRDAERAVAPLRPAEDAHIIDCTDLSVEQVVERIVELANAAGANHPR